MVRLFFVRCAVSESGAYSAYVSIYDASKVQKEPDETIFLQSIIVVGKELPKIIILRYGCQNLNQLLTHRVHKCE